MDAVIVSLIETLRKSVPMLVRVAPASGEALEGVLAQQDLAQCCALLNETLGPPLKDFNQAKTFELAVQKLVVNLGGIRMEQCLFLKQIQPSDVIYATLWPWASDPTRITIKVGLLTVEGSF